MVERIDIERALEDLTCNEGGMIFQGLAVVLAKIRSPADLSISGLKHEPRPDSAI